MHTPEFGFEHDAGNVRRAVADMAIDYPVALDNDYAVWGAFANHYWPALYFADAQGHIRHHYFGEGEYQQSEMVIQRLLAEAGSAGAGHDLVSADARGVEAPADWASLQITGDLHRLRAHRELRVPRRPGAGPAARLSRPGAAAAQPLGPVRRLDGGGQAATADAAGGQIACRFHARDLHLVMGPAAPGTPVRFQVLLDGQPPGARTDPT